LCSLIDCFRRYSNQSVPLTRSTRSEDDGCEDESSDYAYIDRSTHSITGYINNSESRRRSSGIGFGGGIVGCLGDDRELVTRQINLSPYATTEIVKKHRKGSQQAKEDQNNRVRN
jgi:hypothetical protein